MFRDRRDAGRRLASRLAHLRGKDPVVLGLPRGGVIVAAEVAEALNAPLDVCVVRKLGVPFQQELAMGAIASGGVCVLNPDVVRLTGVTQADIDQVTASEREELGRREIAYRRGATPVPVDDRVVIVVDDGIATGATMKAALASLRRRGVRDLVAAVPVGPPDTLAALAALTDEVVCLEEHVPFVAVGAWYQSFEQTTDDEVRAALARRLVS